MRKLKVLDLFSGIGGFSLGLERTGGFETVAFCEIDPFCQRVLKKHWPDVPIDENVKAFSWAGDCDVISGGFPCQRHSTASRGRRVAECLWMYMWSVVHAKRPKIVIAENVQEKPIRGAENDCKQLGYRTTVRRISADEAGADHQRNRWWLVAHPYDESEFQRTLDAEVAKLPEICSDLWGAEAYAQAIRVSDGVSDRLDENRRIALGNAVLPQIPQAIGHAILTAEAQ